MRKTARPRLVRLALAAGLVLAAVPTVHATGEKPGRFVAIPDWDAPHHPDTLIVGFLPAQAALSARAEVHAAAGVATRVKSFTRIAADVVRVNPGASLTEAAAAYAATGLVEYAEPNYLGHGAAAPNDSDFSLLWGMHNTGQTGGTPDADIDAPEAWDIATGSGNLVVGVIDSGADYNHPDLAANMWTNPGEIAANGVDDDGNGIVDDVHGARWTGGNGVPTSGDPMDDHGHGTHVSGSIAGVGNNGSGVAGVLWHARIMALKWLDSSNSGFTADAIAAIDYALDKGTRLTNNSWYVSPYSQALYDIIQVAGAQDQLFVAAALNSGSDNDVTPVYPASYDLDNIIAVGATDHNDTRASFSNYGATSVDIGAPGVSIWSAKPGGTYQYFQGTSMATPHVTGAAALLHDVHPGWTRAQVKNQILASADFKPQLVGLWQTCGRLNLATALGPQLPTFVPGCAPPAPPDLDRCAYPGCLSDGVSFHGSTELATGTDITSCASDDSLDVWHVYRADASGNVTISTCNPGTNFDTTLAVFSACGGAELACNDDTFGCSLASSVTLSLTANQAYLIRVAGYAGSSGSYEVKVTGGQGTCPPANDTCGDGACVADDQPILGSTLDDLVGGTPSSCVGGSDTRDVWYDYTPVVSGPVVIDTCGPATDYDTTLAVFDGCGGAELACSDDDCNVGSYLSSAVVVDMVAGKTYRIRVSGWNGNIGTFELKVAGQGAGVCALYDESFEGGAGGHALSGLWHPTRVCEAASGAHSTTSALYYGVDSSCNYDAGDTSGNALSPVISLASANGPQARFRYLLQTENIPSFYDQARVYVEHGGDETLVASNEPGGSTFYLSDPSNGWQEARVSLSPWAGQDVQLRFSFDTVDGVANNYKGFYVDDLEILPCVADGPAQTYPGNESINVPRTGTTALWNGPAQDPDCPVTWDMWYAAIGAPAFLHACNDVSSPSCPFPPLAAQTTYQWYASASSACTCDEVLGPIWSFTTAAGPAVVSILRNSANPTKAASVKFKVAFTESVTGVDTADFCLVTDDVNGASITSVTGSGASYTVTVATGTGDGTIRLDLCDNDTIVAGGVPLGGPGPGNGDFTGETYVVDKTKPTVVLSTPSPVTGETPIPVTATFSEVVTGFVATDVTLTNCTISDFVSVDGRLYTFNLNPTIPSGTVTAKVPAAKASDAAGNTNLASNLLSILYDGTPPVATALTRSSANPSKATTVKYALVISEVVTGVDSGDFTVTMSGVSGAFVSAVAGGGSAYTVTVNTGSGDGTLRLNLADNDSIQDLAGNPLGGPGGGNGNFTGETYTIDKTRPGVSLTTTAPEPTPGPTIPVTATFTETVTGFVAGDLTVTNANVTDFAGSGSSYTFKLVPLGPGKVTVKLAAGKAADAAGNTNTASNMLTRTYQP